MTESRSLRRSSRRSAAHVVASPESAATTSQITEPPKTISLPPKPPAFSVPPALAAKGKRKLQKRVSFSPSEVEGQESNSTAITMESESCPVEHSVEVSLAECGHDMSFTDPDAERDLKCSLCWKTREMFVDNLLGPLMGLFDVGDETVEEDRWDDTEKAVFGGGQGRLTELRVVGEEEGCPSVPTSRISNHHKEINGQYAGESEPLLPALIPDAQQKPSTRTATKPPAPASPRNTCRPASPSPSSSPPLSSPPPTPPPQKRSFSTTADESDSDSEESSVHSSSTGSVIHVALPSPLIAWNRNNTDTSSPAAKRTRLNSHPRHTAETIPLTSLPDPEPQSPVTPSAPFVSKSGVKVVGKTPGRFLGRSDNSVVPLLGNFNGFVTTPYRSNSTVSDSGKKNTNPGSTSKKTPQLDAGQSKIMSFFKPLNGGPMAARVVPSAQTQAPNSAPPKSKKTPRKKEPVRVEPRKAETKADMEVEEEREEEEVTPGKKLARRRRSAPVQKESHAEMKVNRISLAARKRKRGPNGTFLPKAVVEAMSKEEYDAL